MRICFPPNFCISFMSFCRSWVDRHKTAEPQRPSQGLVEREGFESLPRPDSREKQTLVPPSPSLPWESQLRCHGGWTPKLGHLYFLCSPYSICSPAWIPTCCLQRRSQTPPPHSSQGPTSRFLSGLTVLDVDETPFGTDPPSSLERNSPFEAFIY